MVYDDFFLQKGVVVSGSMLVFGEVRLIHFNPLFHIHGSRLQPLNPFWVMKQTFNSL